LGSNSTISSSVWNHIAVTYDGSTLRLYLNGSQDASKSTTGAFAITNYLLNIGRNSGHPTYSRYKGQIDDVKIYNYARSAGDIQAEYEAYWNSRTIVYASNQSGNYDIYLMKADGTGAIPLTNDPADEMWPKWSPDGTKISYGKDPYGSNEVWVMNADGSNKTLVKAGGWPPCWLPDNSGLIYTRYEENRAKVYKINLNGTNDTLFLDSNVIPNKYGIYGLSLNQDGTKLVWAEQIGSWSPTLELYKAPVTTSSWTVDTTNIVQLTNDGMYDDVSHARAWNNDGSKIVYWHCNGGSGYDGSLFEVYVMNADGTGVTQLTNNSAAEEEASWTPDGRIIFDSNRDGGRRHIFIMNADGTSVTQLTSGSYVAFQPCQR
jgi:TolB protein